MYNSYKQQTDRTELSWLFAVADGLDNCLDVWSLGPAA